MEEIKYLLPNQPKFYKANLHTHTTISDGNLSREEAKEAYKKLGYQILCLTDHNVIANHSDLSEPDFLMLTGIEIGVRAPDRSKVGGEVYHMNLIAKEPDILWTPTKVKGKYPEAAKYEEKMQCEGMKLQCNPDSINAMIEKATEKGLLVMYNHPTWSCQSYPSYAPLKGLCGMEVRNSECCLLGLNENNVHVYKDLLSLGNRIYPLGTDDMHKPRALGLSWIMVGAEALDYASVIKALENGDFYMSCGPEITDLYIEENILKIRCSEAQRINVETSGRCAGLFTNGDDPIQYAEFDLSTCFDGLQSNPNTFFFVTVTDKYGNYAVTRGYFIKDLIEEK